MARFRIVLASLVTAVWLIGYVLAYATHEQAPAELSGLMVVVLGWAFGAEVRDAIRRRNGSDETQD